MASAQLQEIIDLLRAAEAARGEDATLEQRRAAMETWSPPPPEGTHVDPVDAGGVPAEWVNAPDADAGHVVLYLHGGGYCLGSLNTHRNMAGRISAATGSFVLLADYRLAPEHPHPAAVDDGVEVYRWLLQNGTDPTRTAIMGDSAGGGLVVATLLALRDRGEPLPGAAVCMSPWVDLGCDTPTYASHAEADPMCSPELLRGMAAHYVGTGGDAASPLISPVRGDLADLPPMLIQVGSDEVLLDDSRTLAKRAEEAGVDVTLEVWDEMIHVFQAMGGLPEAEEALARIGEFVRKHTAWG